jgi:hypothetical protein
VPFWRVKDHGVSVSLIGSELKLDQQTQAFNLATISARAETSNF